MLSFLLPHFAGSKHQTKMNPTALSPTTTTTPPISLLPPLPKPTTTSSAAHSTAATTTHNPKPPKFRYQDAFPSFLPLHTKNPHAIYRDIKRFASQNKLHQALVILDYLYHQGVPVNATTFSSLLSACSRSRNLAFGRQVHAHIRTNGLDSNEFLVAKLVQMYSCCNSPEDARRLLSSSALPLSVYTWNGLLRGNVIGGGRWSVGTLEVFEEMRELGVELNEYSYSCLIKSISGSPSVIQGMKAHGLLIKEGFLSSSVVLQTSMIHMYFKCGKVRLALKLFDEIPKRDVVGWGAVIAGFAHNGLKREAVEYLRWMRSEGIEPNSVILVTILPAIGELSERKLGKEIHGFAMKLFSDYPLRHFIHSGLVDMYCKCRDVVSARRVFYGSSRRNKVLWTAMMSGYASNGRFEQALRSIIWMQQEGVKPDVVSIATALPVCAKLKAMKSGKEIHAYALKLWLLPNVSIATSLMTTYSICGNLVYTKKIFDKMEKKNIIAWTAMVDAYLKNDRLFDALGVFRSMQLSKHRPDSVTMARALSACGGLGALKLGKEIHGQVLRRKMEWLPFVSAETINMYGRCGEVGMAKRVFEQSSKGSLTWTAIIDAHRFNNLYINALELFDRMQSDGFIPNLFTVDVILSICRSAGLPDEALKAYDSMVGKYNLKASKEHLNCMIDILTLAERTEEAQRFIKLKSSVLV